MDGKTNAEHLEEAVIELYKAKLAVQKDQELYASRGQLRQNHQYPSWPAYEKALDESLKWENEIIREYIARQEHPELFK